MAVKNSLAHDDFFFLFIHITGDYIINQAIIIHIENIILKQPVSGKVKFFNHSIIDINHIPFVIQNVDGIRHIIKNILIKFVFFFDGYYLFHKSSPCLYCLFPVSRQSI